MRWVFVLAGWDMIVVVVAKAAAVSLQVLPVLAANQMA